MPAFARIATLRHLMMVQSFIPLGDARAIGTPVDEIGAPRCVQRQGRARQHC